MREEIQKQLIRLGPKFWKTLEDMPPKVFLETYLKMMAYGFAKPPEERPIGDEERGRLIIEERTRKATLIGGGLPPEPAEVFDE